MTSAGLTLESTPSGNESRSLWGSGVLRPQAGVEIDMLLPDIDQTDFDRLLIFGTCGKLFLASSFLIDSN